MPFISVRSAMPISESMMETLQKEIGRIITIIPGKTIDNCMTMLDGSIAAFMSGKPAKAVFCEIRVFGKAPKDKKASVVSELNDLFAEKLGAEKVYIHIIESDEWGSNGKYLG